MMTARALRRTIAIGMFVLGAASAAQAQGFGTIGGTVLDESGAVLPGVTVTLLNPGAIGDNRQAVTDGTGAYQFPRLVPGTYSVRGELSGFKQSVVENIRVSADFTARADLRLGVGDLQESITVSGEAPAIDTASALHQAVMAREILDTLPGTNDTWGIARLVPGIIVAKYDVGGSESFGISQTSAHGSNYSGESQFQVDGMGTDATSGQTGANIMYYDTFMFEEINYKTSNMPAENTRGGVIYNYVTKTGTNKFRGNFLFDGGNQHMQSNNITPALAKDLLTGVPAKALAANPGLQPGAKILDIVDTGLNGSGPIIKDKLWFVASARLNTLNQLRIGSYNSDGTQFLDDNKMYMLSQKVSWAVSSNSQVHFNHLYAMKQRYHYNPAPNCCDFIESAATGVQKFGTHIPQVKWTTTLSPRLLLDVSGSWATSVASIPFQPGTKPDAVANFELLSRTLTVVLPTTFEQHYLRAVAQASATYSATRHDVKVGYQYDLGRLYNHNYSTSNMQALFRNGVPDSVNTYNTPTTVVERVGDHGVYAQDRWKPTSKLGIDMGLRLERAVGSSDPICQVQTVFVAAQCFGPIKNTPNWLDVAPRLSVIYDVRGDGRTALKFGANRYNVGVGNGFPDVINPVRVTSDTRKWTDSNSDLIPQLNELGPSTGYNIGTTNHYNPDVKRPYTVEYSVELQQQMFGDVVLSVAYFHRNPRRAIGSMNLAAPTSAYTPISVKEVSSGRQVTVYNLDPALRGKLDFLYDNFSQLGSTFNGVDMTVNKRLGTRLMLMSGVSVGKNTGDIFGTADLNNPNNAFRHGLVGNDVPFSLKMSGSYELPYGFRADGVFIHNTGFPETTTVSVGSSTVALTQVTQSLVVDPRGTTRLPDINLLDANLKKRIKVGGGRTIEPAFEAFNILNANTIQARTNTLGPAYGRVSNIVRGRMFKARVNISF